MSLRLRFVILVLLVSASVAGAVPTRDFDAATKEFHRSEEDKQLWLKPDQQKELRGDFIGRLLKDASLGHAKAQATLGLCYHIGFGVKRNLATAIEWYQKAADGGHAGAQNNLAHLYDFGTGLPRDPDKAQSLYLAAAQQGLADAQFNVGLNYALGIAVPQDWKKAAAWYEKAAKQNNLAAMTNLGNIYVLGRGTPIDFEEARKWLQKPAEAGLALSQYSLAATYMGQQKEAEAVPWLRRSAQGGFPAAALYLAHHLFLGQGVPKNLDEALPWARKAAADTSLLKGDMPGNAHAMVADILLAIDLEHPEQVATNGAEAFREASSSAEIGNLEGQRALALCYHRGVGVERDFAAAAKWYRLSAEQGQPQSASILGIFLEQGRGVTRDFTEAAKWYRFAAEHGDPMASARLGLFYRDGTGVETNLEEAAKWLHIAQRTFTNDLEIKTALADVERITRKSPADAAYERGVFLAGQAEKGARTTDEAIAQLQQAADLGHARAAATLATVYRRGVGGIPPDEAKAEALIARIEKTSDPVLLHLIANSYLPAGTQPLEKNVERVVGLLQRSAVQGYAPAQNALGFLLMISTDEHKDWVEAFKWLTLAKDQGNDTARINMDNLRPHLTPEQILEGTQRAKAFHPVRETP